MGTNRYAYSQNDPVNKSDPNGHSFLSGLKEIAEKISNAIFGGATKEAKKEATKNADNPLGSAVKENKPTLDTKKKAANDETATTADKKKGSYQKPENLIEKMLMNKARQNPTAGKPMYGKNTDPNFLAENGWQKMEMTEKTNNGAVAEIHYQYNSKTGQVADVKAINRSSDSSKNFWNSAATHLSTAAAALDVMLRETSLNTFDAGEAH